MNTLVSLNLIPLKVTKQKAWLYPLVDLILAAAIVVVGAVDSVVVYLADLDFGVHAERIICISP